ncbi:3-methyladenine DNA glycosylase [Mesobacillus boroniphilus]|uniref:3-methyladenine DNA glycosylase n=1 Tax=Mesobacillus boroniphilus TaxID=308892 RepID=A0A944GW24_9BACI|nr:3-methyladenine DNA glycosylase [Mesobacillus boroniphilus]MBS8263185.1 3-methyladenine DNA glycosylase [Mesobacillus boroniphilus]
MPEKNQNNNDGSVEQEKKKAHNKDIEPQRDPVKPQEESNIDK